MKKSQKLLITFFVCFIAFVGLSQFKVRAFYENGSENYIGRAVNVLKYDYENFGNISQDDIFTNALFTSSYVTTNTLPSTYEITKVYSGETMQSYYQSIKSRYSTEVSVEGSYGMHTGSIDLNFVNSNTVDFSQQRHSLFERFTYENKVYEKYLPAFYSHQDLYKNNLDADFLASLYYLNSHRTPENVEAFFNNYGTHVITQAYFGGKLDVYYTAATNYVNLTTTQKNDIKAEIEYKMTNLMSIQAGVNQEINFENKTSLENVSISTNFISVKSGGNTLGLKSYAELNTNFDSWAKSIDSAHASYMGVKDNTLLPIWNVLPSQYLSLASYLQQTYNTMALSIGANINADLSNALPNSYTKTINVRTDEKLITDSGRANQWIDQINVTSTTGLNFNKLKAEGFETVNIKITFDQKEKYDGYQYVFLYTEKDTSSTKLFEQQFNRGDGRQTTYTTLNTFDNSFDIDSLQEEGTSDSDLFIYWGASGNLGDDWYCKNVVMTIVVK